MTCAILAAIADLPTSSIDLFLDSLQATSFDGDLIVFASRVGPDVHRLLSVAGAKICLFDFPKHIDQVACLRYFLYQHFLDQFPDAYDNILLTDVTDVCFQDNPFVGESASMLQVFAEDSRTPIGACPFNSHWIETRFGVGELQKLANARIICSGTSIGTQSGIQDYLQHMTKHLVPAMPIRGYDQGVHNYIVHNSVLSEVTIVENGTGTVLTMGLMPFSEIRLNESGMVVDETGRVIPVLHQFNRHPEIEQTIRASVQARSR